MRSTTRAATALLLTLAVRTPLSATGNDTCWPTPDGPTELLVCRGGPTMGGISAREAPLVLRIQWSPHEVPTPPADLPAGSCTWARRVMKATEPRVLVFPRAEHAPDPYPIADQARVCAANVSCVMTFCAQVVDRELRAAEGPIRVSFW